MTCGGSIVHKLKRLIAFVAATLGGIAPALAGELAALVHEPVFAPVSVSVGTSVTRASYKFQLKNTSTSSSLNTVRLVGTTSVTGGNSGAKATFEKSSQYVCTPNADRTSIDCAIGALAAGISSIEFTVTFFVPTSGTNIAFAWTAVFDNGTPPGNSNGDSGTENIGLFYSTSLASTDVPAGSALTFFTGSGVATQDDQWVTIVKIPKTLQATTATVEEGVSLSTCAADLIDCRTSTLTVLASTFGEPGQRPLVDPTTGNSPFLQITLLRDASTIAKGAKIDSAILYYKHDPNAPGLGEAIQSCADTTLPKLHTPCEDRAQRVAYPSKSRPKDSPVPAGFAGDWKFVIYLYDNGRITN
jgi:hypothetical protein